MADHMDRVELLMGLAKNERAENNEWRNQVYKEGQERYRRMKSLANRFEQEYAAVDAELQLLEQYMPKDQLPKAEQPMPKVVTQGPRS